MNKIEQIKSVVLEGSKLLYQNKVEEGYKYVNDLIGILIEFLNEEENEKVKKINLILEKVLIAMEEQDAVLVADILRYDLIEIIETEMDC